MKQKIIILGSTGSIGRSLVDIIKKNQKIIEIRLNTIEKYSENKLKEINEKLNKLKINNNNIDNQKINILEKLNKKLEINNIPKIFVVESFELLSITYKSKFEKV